MPNFWQNVAKPKLLKPKKPLTKNKKNAYSLSREETDIELAFLETKVREIEAKVQKYVAEKQARQNVEAKAVLYR